MQIISFQNIIKNENSNSEQKNSIIITENS